LFEGTVRCLRGPFVVQGEAVRHSRGPFIVQGEAVRRSRGPFVVQGRGPFVEGGGCSSFEGGDRSSFIVGGGRLSFKGGNCFHCLREGTIRHLSREEAVRHREGTVRCSREGTVRHSREGTVRCSREGTVRREKRPFIVCRGREESVGGGHSSTHKSDVWEGRTINFCVGKSTRIKDVGVSTDFNSFCYLLREEMSERLCSTYLKNLHGRLAQLDRASC
jgi:hypothetical protein